MKIIILSLLLLVMSIFVVSPAIAQTQATSEAKLINVSYDLPYPGILPDNPLYFVKAIRDNLLNFFITDSLKKSDYDLLMADKRLVSAQSLIKKNNYSLAITTLSKSGNYFDQSIQFAVLAKQQGKDTRDILDRLYRSSEKHQQIIYFMSQNARGGDKVNLELLQVRAKNFEDTVDVLRSQ